MRNLVWALFLCVAIAGCSSEGGQGPFHPASPLDKILVMGKDTRGAWKQFMHDGGLQASDQWKAYTVQNVSLGFDPKNRLTEISMILSSGVHGRTPSLEHISQDLAGICGKDWRKGSKGSPAMAENGDTLCIYSPSKNGNYYQLEINKMESMGAPGMGMMGTPKM